LIHSFIRLQSLCTTVPDKTGTDKIGKNPEGLNPNPNSNTRFIDCPSFFSVRVLTALSWP